MPRCRRKSVNIDMLKRFLEVIVNINYKNERDQVKISINYKLFYGNGCRTTSYCKYFK